ARTMTAALRPGMTRRPATARRPVTTARRPVTTARRPVATARPLRRTARRLDDVERRVVRGCRQRGGWARRLERGCLRRLLRVGLVRWRHAEVPRGIG